MLRNLNEAVLGKNKTHLAFNVSQKVTDISNSDALLVTLIAALTLIQESCSLHHMYVWYTAERQKQTEEECQEVRKQEEPVRDKHTDVVRGEYVKDKNILP